MNLRFFCYLLLLLVQGCDYKPEQLNLLEDANYKKFNSFYDIKTDKIQIKEQMYIDGKIDAKNSKFANLIVTEETILHDSVIENTLEIKDTAELTNTAIQGQIIGKGNIKVYNSFIKSINIEADEIYLSASVVENISIKSHNLKSKSPKVILENGSKVVGDIKTEHPQSNIVVSKDSKFNGKHIVVSN